MIEALGLTTAFAESEEFAAVFAGNGLLPGMKPYAACYGGHQFGNWAGQLGDGRAISLGETVNASNERWELQLKGAGRTPYSRHADGRAVLRSSIREFLCSEAMHHLGIPTTRALSLVATGDSVIRDMFYNGNARPEPGAIVCRVAPSFIRFGNFEILAARNDAELMRQLVDFTIARDFPHIDVNDPSRVVTWFTDVCRRTAEMIVHWMRVGFTHGVMNTDNMSILGLTIDYGPFGFLDNFDPDWTPNTTDSAEHRYAFAKQPSVALWNLARLGDALGLITALDAQIGTGLDAFRTSFNAQYTAMMAAKLGFPAWGTIELELATDLFNLMERTETDFTLLFRTLDAVVTNSFDVTALRSVSYAPNTWDEHGGAWAEWCSRYVAHTVQIGESTHYRVARMHHANPSLVLRNYIAQQTIDAAESGDANAVYDTLNVFRTPYVASNENAHFAAMRPDWAKDKAGCSRLSCSS